MIPIAPFIPLIGDVIDRILPDREAAAKAKLELMTLQQQGQFRELEARMSAIVMEAQSSDKWTSRARPSFMYIMYVFLLASLPFGLLFYYDPVAAATITQGVGSWLNSIPENMWWLFGAGYLGYGFQRSWDKRNIIEGKKQ
jgi:hypothetical protein